jgi:hypothetical protein
MLVSLDALKNISYISVENITNDNVSSVDSIKTNDSIDDEFDEDHYLSNIMMPLIVGLFVTMLLGWMLVRYKMSSAQRSNYNGSIYCCPEDCFDCFTKFFLCNFGGFNLFLKKSNKQNSSKTPKITLT